MGKQSLWKRNKTGKGAGRKKGKSIAGMLSARISILCVFVSVVLGGANILMLFQSSGSSMREQVKAASSSYNLAVRNAIDKYKLSAEAVAGSGVLSAGSSAKADDLDRLARTYGFYRVEVADAAGKTKSGTQVGDTEYFKNAMQGRTYLSSTFQYDDDGTMMLAVATKIPAAEGGADSVAVCYLSIGTLNSLIGDVKVGQSGYGFILDKTGKIVAHKDISLALNGVNYMEEAKKDPSLSGWAGLAQAMTGGVSGSAELSADGRREYVLYVPVTNTDGWSIGIVAYEDEMLSGLYATVAVTVALIAVFILLSIFLSRRIALRIARPMLALSGRIGALAEGDLHSEVPAVRTGDEIQTLSETLSSTVEALNGHIGEISTVLDGMAQGDFTVQAARTYKGDFSAIREALDTIVSSMNAMFAEISQMAERVYAGSRQMTDGSQALAQGATEQAGTVEQLTASIREIARKVEESSRYAVRADKLAADAMGQVKKGGGQMERMVSAMARIDESSGRIGKIIKTIQDISFQTNILALNAAVEAARAGEAGRGFSVVADEVRNLAGKSSEAVRDTSALIRDSLDAVEEGRRISDETAASLREIVKGVELMNALFAAMSKASAAQAQAIGQIEQGSGQISTVVQTNSATAEQGAATSGELNRLAQELRDMLGKLRLREAPAPGQDFQSLAG